MESRAKAAKAAKKTNSARQELPEGAQKPRGARSEVVMKQLELLRFLRSLRAILP